MEHTFEVLREIVTNTACKPFWSFELIEQDNIATLVIAVIGPDAFKPEQLASNVNEFRCINHLFPVPIATYNEKSWRRWVFEMCRRVENHELGEWFRVGHMRPFLPLHGPGEDPYTVHEFRDRVDALTTQDGFIREEKP